MQFVLIELNRAPFCNANRFILCNMVNANKKKYFKINILLYSNSFYFLVGDNLCVFFVCVLFGKVHTQTNFKMLRAQCVRFMIIVDDIFKFFVYEIWFVRVDGAYRLGTRDANILSETFG